MNLNKFLEGYVELGSSESQFRKLCYYSSVTKKVTWHFNRKDLIIKYSKKICWRELKTDIEFASDLELPIKIDKITKYSDRPTFQIAVLKSNLQKAIRRQNLKSALSSAIQLYNIDPLILVRRLSIISLEDVILLEDFPYLLFIMVVYPRMEPDLNFLLQMINSMILSPKRDYIPNTLVIEEIKLNNLLVIEKSLKLGELEISLLYSLNLRSSYGGLKGDVDMINGYAKLWTLRFTGKSRNKWINFLIPTVQTECLNLNIKFDIKFDINDLLLESVDFHTCPGMLKELLNCIIGINSEKLKNIIWYCRSGVNSRGNRKVYLDNQEKYKKIYVKIEKLLNKYSQNQITKAFTII